MTAETINKKQGWLFIIPWSVNEKGGVSQVVRSLFNEMKIQSYGYAPFIIEADWDSVLLKKGGRKNIFRFRFTNPGKSIKSFLMFLFQIVRLSAFIHYHHIRVINIHYPNEQFYIFKFMKEFNIFRGKLIYSFHGTDLYQNKHTDTCLNFLSKSASAVCCSRDLCNKLLSFSYFDAQNIYCINNGVALNATTRNPKIALPHSYLVCVGTYSDIKGQDLLLHTFAQIKLTFPDLNIVFIGRSTDYLEHLKNLAKSLGIDNKVYFYCDKDNDEVLYVISKAEALILPSRREAFGIVLIEAGLFNVPIIASDLPGIKDIVSDNNDGLLFETENISDLAAKINYLLTNPDFARRTACNLNVKVLNNFSWEKALNQYVSLGRAS